jgi:hypothetical protein
MSPSGSSQALTVHGAFDGPRAIEGVDLRWGEAVSEITAGKFPFVGVAAERRFR